MSLKKVGSIDFGVNGLGWFVCYYTCPVCKKKIKVILRKDEFSDLCERLGKQTYKGFGVRQPIKRLLTALIEVL